MALVASIKCLIGILLELEHRLFLKVGEHCLNLVDTSLELFVVKTWLNDIQIHELHSCLDILWSCYAADSVLCSVYFDIAMYVLTGQHLLELYTSEFRQTTVLKIETPYIAVERWKFGCFNE